MQKLTIFLLLAFLISSCAQKQAVQHDSLKLSDSWDNNSEMHNISNEGKVSDAQKNWWKDFKDPQLNELISLAIENNLDNKIAIARVKQARADGNVTYSDLLPNINATESASSSKQIVSGASPKTNLITTALDLSWELDFFGKQRHLTQADAYSTM